MSGQIKAERSAGGHYRIVPAELERLKALQTLPAVAHATITNGARQAKRNPNELLAEPSIDVIQSAEDAFVSDRELVTDRNRLDRMRARKEMAELGDFFALREQARIDKELQEERRAAELAEKRRQQREAEMAAQERRQFQTQWISYALEHRPLDSPPDYVLLVKPDLLAALAEIEPDEDDAVVRVLVDAVVERALGPPGLQSRNAKPDVLPSNPPSEAYLSRCDGILIGQPAQGKSRLMQRTPAARTPPQGTLLPALNAHCDR